MLLINFNHRMGVSFGAIKGDAHLIFMELSFEYPKLEYGNNPSAVYKMTFDTGHFYIGSSKHVKTRINIWRTSLRRLDFSSKIIMDVLPKVTKVSFLILKTCPTIKLLEIETKHILKHKDNDLCLNMTLNAVNNSVRKPLPEHLRKPRKVQIPKQRKGKFAPPEDHVYVFSKEVRQYDLSGNYIKTFRSINEAARAAGVDRSVIADHLKVGAGYGIGGHVFRGENSPPLPFRIKKWIPREKVVRLAPNGSKPVIDMNTGVFYYSAKEVADLNGIKLKEFYKMLTCARVNTTQYKYA